MTKEEFKEAAQGIYDEFEDFAGDDGHQAMDNLMWKCLRDLGYDDGLDILNKLSPIWYC